MRLRVAPGINRLWGDGRIAIDASGHQYCSVRSPGIA